MASEALAAELKEIIQEGHKQMKDATDKVVKGHEELDGRIGKIQSELESQGKEYSESKEAFKAAEEKLVKLESDFDAAQQKLAETLRGGQAANQKSYAALAAECKEAADYNDGNLTLCKFEGSAFEQKNVTSAGASAGPLVEPYIMPGLVRLPEQPLMMRDILPVMPTSSPALEYYAELAFTNNAQPQENEGDTKGQSNITYEKRTGTTETIAHWIPMSRQILSDARMLQGWIEGKMRYGLALEEDTQLLAGDGLGGNISGLLTEATAYNTGLNVSGDKKVDMLRRAALQCVQAYYPCTFFAMTPAEWCNIELTKTTDNAYLFTNPVNGAQPRIWGKRVVESFGMSGATFLAGSSFGATIWDREQVIVRVSDSHADNFVKNMLVMLVEERVGLTVEVPAAFITGTLADTA